MKDFSSYLYYKGEKDCPFYGTENAGKRTWWRIEHSAFNMSDKKEHKKLSKTMLNFIREWHWEPTHDISWEKSVERATEIYNKGIFNSEYLCMDKIEGLPQEFIDALGYK